MTSFDSDNVTIEEKMKKESDSSGKKKKVKKVLVKTKKTFVWVSDVEALITFIAHHRGYADEDLQIEMGIDAGQAQYTYIWTVRP